ncbi:MAG: DNA mismatch repair protein MutS [Deltaproteobacteria bacterium]|nr:DNA mismatch repair protein MutS [Deltaproteobacteria bacterium]
MSTQSVVPINETETPVAAAALTPMMRQYYDIKSQYTDAIVLYRLGDFYEMFHDDAVLASSLLDLTLTTRNKNSENQVPLCGVPYHSVEGYIAKLIKCGKKVVVCEQTEDPKQAKGLVRREVTRVVSPGIVLEEQSLTARANNFVLCFIKCGDSMGATDEKFACALCDVSTGLLEYFFIEGIAKLKDEIARLGIREFFYRESDRDSIAVKEITQTLSFLYHHAASDLFSDADFAADLLFKYYNVGSLSALDLVQKDAACVLGLMLGFLNEIKILSENLLQQPVLREGKTHLFMDEPAIRTLELFKTLRDDHHQGTLLWHLDHCRTAMGSRRLCEFIRSPLMEVNTIESRLSAVEEILNTQSLQDLLDEFLKGIADLERLANRFVVKTANARDAVVLKESVGSLPRLKQGLLSCQSPLLQELGGHIHDLGALATLIDKTILEEPAPGLKDGGIIAFGVSAELDELREIEKSGKGTIARMESTEREKTGISSLKIRYNNIFGYYIEITNTHKDKVPDRYFRKQTLTNSERYITEELKQYESKVLGAHERIKALEYDLFCALRDKVHEQCPRIKETAGAVAVVDVLHCFATVARRFRYIRPKVTEESVLDLKGARHPILERLNPSESFVPNDLGLDSRDNSLMIITGPNMAGKSTVMRMTALISIMAQMGSFVPCDEALVGIADRIFTRVGAHDHLQKGLSTFMVEMVETAKILREATPRSLIILDEIGRGTSTFDGLSIAWAVAEDIHDRLHARTLFATHYHELCDLAEQRRGINNFQMAVREWGGRIIFLRKFKPGGSNRSYGVAVASMAGLPVNTVNRAKEILKLLELKDVSFKSELDKNEGGQMSLFDQAESQIIKRLQGADINQLTPLEALQFLADLKDMVK